MTVDIIVTVRGGAAITEAIIAGGALLGFNSGDVDPPDGTPQFIDWPHYEHSRVAWGDHIDAVRKYEPRYAVAPDAGDDWPVEWTLDRADILDKYADTVIVPAKSIHPRDVPDRFRVGLPFASSDYSGGLEFSLTAYQNQPIHVLGGDPDRIYRTFFGPGAGPAWDVRSFDTSRPYLLAEKGEVWTQEHNRVERFDLDLRERIALTIFNLRVAVNGRQADTLDYEAIARSGRVPPIPPARDLAGGEAYDEMVERFERIMGETPEEFRRQQAGPNSLPDPLPEVSDPDYDRYQVPRSQEPSRRRSETPVTDDEQDTDDVDEGQSDLSSFEGRELTEGERRMREHLRSDDDEDDDDENGQSSLSDFAPDGGRVWA